MSRWKADRSRGAPEATVTADVSAGLCRSHWLSREALPASRTIWQSTLQIVVTREPRKQIDGLTHHYALYAG